MIKKLICQLFLFPVIILLTINCFAQLRPAVAWQKCIGGTSPDIANDVLITNDGNIVIVGVSYSTNADFPDHHGTNTTSDACIVKMDTSGNIIWKKSIGGTANDFFTTVINAVDGGYICTGTTFSYDGDIIGHHGSGDILAVKVNTDGTIAWSKCYGGSLYDYGADVTQTPDGNYAFMGTAFSYNGDVLSGQFGRLDSDAWAFKTDPSGNIIWEKCLDFAFNFYHPNTHLPYDVGYNICRSETGNLYAFTTGTIDFDSHYTQPFADTPRAARAELYELNNANGNITLIGPAANDRNTGSKTDTLCSMFKAITKTYFGVYSNGFDPHDHCFKPFFGNAYAKLDGTNAFSGVTTLISTGYENLCGGDGYMGQARVAPVHGVSEEPTLDAFIAIGFRLPYFDNAGAFLSINNKQYIYGTQNGTATTAFNAIKVFPSGSDYIVVGYAGQDGGDVSGVHTGANAGPDMWVVKLQSLNKIVGNVFVDANNNNIMDAGELPFTGGITNTTKQGFQVSAVPSNGFYRNLVDTGTFTTVFNVNRPYHTITPASKTSVFTTYRNTDTANFAVHPIPGIQDYTISMIATWPPRVNSDLQYKVPYFNTGTTTLTNKYITFVKDHRMQFVGSTPANTSISGDTIKWLIPSLAPWTGGNITVTLHTTTPPALNNGDTLRNRVLIDSTGDYHVADNYFVLNEIVRGSFDPNDKRESFGGEIYPPDIAAGRYLNYNIRFQNTGTDTAFNIILRDTLDSKLNADSFEVIGASHAYIVNIRDKKYLTVSFNNIKLVDSTHNEPLSHGYFSYRIKPAASLALGDTIRNNASIYFDFNLPVKTNTETTIYTITDQWTGAVSSAWEDPLNWRSHIIPDENTNVILNPGLPHYPVISTNAICRMLIVKGSTSVLVKSGFTLKVTH